MKSIYQVIRKPLFTEKGTAMKEGSNKVLVDVDPSANKVEIKRAIEEIFKVKVEKVATINVRGKEKTYGRFKGLTSVRKKAVITLAEGQKLDFIEGA